MILTAEVYNEPEPIEHVESQEENMEIDHEIPGEISECKLCDVACLQNDSDRCCLLWLFMAVLGVWWPGRSCGIFQVDGLSYVILNSE